MKIIKDGNHAASSVMKGTCHHCWCEVECSKEETRELVDKDTREGSATRYVHCPQCDNQHLWVRPTNS